MEPVIDTEETTLVLSKQWYDALKLVVQIILPGLGALYFSLSEIWGLPGGDKIVGTCSVLAVFLGLLLRVSTKRYYRSGAQYDGVIIPKVDGGGLKGYSLEVPDDLEAIQFKENVNLKVAPKEEA